MTRSGAIIPFYANFTKQARSGREIAPPAAFLAPR
jgi:hypothetical protein